MGMGMGMGMNMAPMGMGMPMVSQSHKKPSPSPAMSSALSVKSDTKDIDNLKKTNETLNQDISKLQSQVNKLKQKCEVQDEQLQKSERRAKSAASLAAEESTRRNSMLDFIRFLDTELKGIVDKVPAEFSDSIKDLQSQSEKYLSGQCSHPPEAISGNEQSRLPIGGMHEITHHIRSASMGTLDGSSLTSESPCHRIMESNGRAPGDFAPKYGTHGEVQLIEQFEPGVYVTLIQLRDGTKVFKRVRFSKRRFAEQQAEEWWRENQERVFRKYNHAPT